ncbi:MAG: Na+/H+ antiporter NhaA [Rhodospirillales bacterium]|nr:Na+/H+ antiporter NhaA [Rhodospirillales bacterium]
MRSSHSGRLAAFFASEVSGGVMLMVAAVLAIGLYNSPLDWLYRTLLDTPVVVRIGALAIDKPLLLWINDGLMVIFFFHVGLEIKREMVEGRLSSWKQASLPAIAAAGGMLVPALIYIALNQGDPTALRGWAIPAATDIAFALGALALLGKRAPISLKIFLLALAILDDLGAIVIIAIFYTDHLSVTALSIAVAGAGVLFAMNMKGVTRISPYLIIGVIMWVCVLKSGVHATLAGVVIALTIPLRVPGGSESSPLHHLEHVLLPWVAFGVMPIFAFANAGVSLTGFSLNTLLAPVPLGIALGLFIGKQVGILGFSWAAIRLGVCAMPAGVNWAQMHGIAILAGIGFTMSLFIGTLAFADPANAAAVRFGVLSGSLLSGITGYWLLRLAGEKQAEKSRHPAGSRHMEPSMSSLRN